MSEQVSRGRFIRNSLVSSLALSLVPASANGALEIDAGQRSLAMMARRAGCYFGAAARIDFLETDPTLRSALVADCSHITPEVHLKWDSLECVKSEFNFGPVDDLLTFASNNSKVVRGHTLIWERSTPEWAKRELLAKGNWSLVAAHFERVLTRYAGLITEWDVVNEPIDTESGCDGLRLTTFHRAFGSSYIERALYEARSYAADATLLLNDYGFEYTNPVDEARREAFLELIERLKKSSVPLDGVGIQAHLDLSKGDVDVKKVRSFLRRIADLGLYVTISELDVKEADFHAPLFIRDHRVAEHTKRYLDVVLSEPTVRGIVTWGLSDRYSWLSRGGENRGLPYDEHIQRKPMYWSINAALGERISPYES